MKKIAAGISIAALVVVAQFALADDTSRTPTQSGTAMTVTGDMCAGWTKGGGASVGKPNNGRTADAASSSMDTSTSATCEAAASSSSSGSAQPANRPDQKIKTKSNIKND